MSRTILKLPPLARQIEYLDRGKPTRQEETASNEARAESFQRLYTIRQAAEITGLKYWLLLRAVNSGDVPSYQFGNARKRVRLSDIEAAIALAGQTRGRVE